VKVPNSTTSLKVSFQENIGVSADGEDKPKFVESLVYIEDAGIDVSEIPPVDEQTVDMEAEDRTLTIYSYTCHEADAGYQCIAAYTFNFFYVNENFRITKEVGNRRLIYNQGAAAAALTVDAVAPVGETINYQWQQSVDGVDYTDIDGAENAAFTPSTDTVGKRMYRVQASNGDKRWRAAASS